MKKGIFRYRIITNLNCNMNESTGVNGNCYFCYQKFKSPLRLDCDKMEKTFKCQTCYYDNRCYWQELADHIPMDCNDYKKRDRK